MTQDSNFIKEIKKSIPKPDEEVIFSTEENNVYIFLSIDISNSTQLKKKISNWMEITKILYGTQVNNMQFWKYNGDEILYAQVFSEINVLVNIINDAYTTIKKIEGKIKNSIAENVQLKATIWLARVAKEDSNFHIVPCEAPLLHIAPNEFLGKSIDEGFRLSKKVSGDKVVIDPKIVYFLLIVHETLEGKEGAFGFINHTNKFWNHMNELKGQEDVSIRCLTEVNFILTNLHFIGYTKLKGIWEEKSYPVYWYYGKESDFHYDEQLDNNYVSSKKLEKFHEEKLRLEEIFTVVDEKNEINLLFETFAMDSNNSLTNIESGAKLYYSVACVHPVTHRILLLKRNDGRKHLRGVWEFPAYAHTKVTVKSYIENRIKEELGLEVKLITDDELEQNIIPIHFCKFYRNNTQHNNLLCIAKIQGDDDENTILSKIISRKKQDKYSDCCFIDENESLGYTPITLEQIKIDSYNVAKGVYDGENGDEFRKCLFNPETKFSSMYLKHSVHAVIEYCKSLERSWWEKYDGR